MSESSGGDRIICRQCGENISISTGNCPHCGTNIRSRFYILAGLVGGVGLFLLSVFAIVFMGEGRLWFFAILSAIAAVISYVFYSDRKTRVQQADDESANA